MLKACFCKNFVGSVAQEICRFEGVFIRKGEIVKGSMRFMFCQLAALTFVFMMDNTNVCGFGDMMQQNSGGKEPAFAALEEGEDLFEGIVKDDQAEISIQQLSFFGHATVGGIRQENNDSMIKLNLATIKRLELIQAQYTSKRYSEKDFSLFRKVSVVPGTAAEVAEEILIPRNVVICGIDKKTGDERSWYLGKVEQLIVIQENGQAQLDMTTTTTAASPIQQPVGKKTLSQVAPKDDRKAFVVVRDPISQRDVLVTEAENASGPKTVLQAITDFIKAFIEIIKSIFNAIKNIFGL